MTPLTPAGYVCVVGFVIRWRLNGADGRLYMGAVVRGAADGCVVSATTAAVTLRVLAQLIHFANSLHAKPADAKS
jgi:hypothetical protein